jgi:hypothetical protein
MTKPIEGWVAWNYEIENRAKDNPIFTNSIFGLTVVDTKDALGVPDPHAPGWVPRPVRIVFMDNTARDLIEDGFEDDTTATTLYMMRSAVMMDREMTWERLKNTEASYDLAPSQMEEFRQAIFGEEK